MGERFDDLPPIGEPGEWGDWREPEARKSGPRKAEPPLIQAHRFAWIEPGEIPIRQWVLGRHMIRKYVSGTVSPGGIGKSSLLIAEAISLAVGRDLIGHAPHGTYRVWYINLEDPLDELQRRVAAVLKHYGITERDLGGRLFVNSGRDTELVIATQNRTGAAMAEPHVEAMKATIFANLIDVVIVDPLISSHQVQENDNAAMDVVMRAYASIAEHTETAIELVHHSKKTGGAEVQMEDARGAVTFLTKVRAGRVLNPMTKDEAERAGVEVRGVHFRVDRGKGNLAPPSSEASTWFKMASVDLDNGGSLNGTPLPGDSVGVVTAWQWPDAFADITAADLRAAQAAVAEGGPWRENVQAKQWVGKPIAEALRLDPDDKQHRERIKRLLRVWIESGMFVVVNGKNEKGRDTPCIEVGAPATD